MLNAPDIIETDSFDCEADASQPVDPFRSLYVHFGMLLGVDDFRTQDAYHRGKMWLHSSWLHGKGVVWGFGVHRPEAGNELRVRPGLALDGLGRELHLEQAACLDLGSWYAENQDNPELSPRIFDDGSIGFVAHVIVRFHGCLSRQVPALSEPCEGGRRVTAYSRVFETVELCLRPGAEPQEDSRRYRRVQVFFGLYQAEAGNSVDDEALTARQAVQAAPPADRAKACADALRVLVAHDTMDLHPEEATEGDDFPLFPELPPGEVVLARIEVRLRPEGDLFRVESAEINNGIRPAHLPTALLQRLTCACSCFDEAVEEPEEPGEDEPPDEGEPPEEGEEPPEEGEAAPGGTGARKARRIPAAPRIVRTIAELAVAKPVVRFVSSRALAPKSVSKDAVQVSVFDADSGWSSIGNARVAYDVESNEIVVKFSRGLQGQLLRIVVSGTGAAPVLSSELLPLAGGRGMAAPPNHVGQDFVFSQELAES